jgi:hypothetical protein
VSHLQHTAAYLRNHEARRQTPAISDYLEGDMDLTAVGLRHAGIDWRVYYDGVVDIFDPSATLESAPSTISLASTNYRGCHNQFYHFVMNAAVPIFAKLVRPYLQRKEVPPRRVLEMLDVGGTANLLPQALPALQFNFTPWVCACIRPVLRCGQCVLCEARHPLYAIDNDDWNSRLGYVMTNGRVVLPPAVVGPHRQLMRDYRAYTLSISPSSSPKAPQFVFLSRNEKASNSLEVRGGEGRVMSPQTEMQLSQAVSTSGLLPGPEELQLVFTENQTFTDQVAMFRGVRLLIAQHGAGMLHCLWMPAGSVVVEIATQSLATMFYFKWLCSNVSGLHFRRFILDTDNSSKIDTARFLTDLGETVRGLWS